MRFAVFGDRGLVGSAASRILDELGYKYDGFNRTNLNLSDTGLNHLTKLVENYEVVINAIGYTAVDDAESNYSEALRANAEIPAILAEACFLSGTRFAHISTDYVFGDGPRTPRLVTDETSPKSAYARSKAVGEQMVLAANTEATIFRSAWLYGENKSCFPTRIRDKVVQSGHAKVVNDQFGQPTFVDDLVDQIITVMTLRERPRILHSVASGKASWCDFAAEIVLSMGLDPSNVIIPVSSYDFPTKAIRPSWSVLDNTNPYVPAIENWRMRWRQVSSRVLQSSKLEIN